MTAMDTTPPRRFFSWRFALFFAILALGVAVVWYFLRQPARVVGVTDELLSGPVQAEFPAGVFIRQPNGPPQLATGALDPHGLPVTASCNTCHSTKASNADLKVGMELKTFHQGLKGNHGNLTCISCHNSSEGYQSLRLADGRALPYADVMQLCAQCHGPQFRDYQHGAHGGMAGYWDLTKGGRVRNNCIDCHDPHAPKYPVVRPAPGPQDRFQHPAPPHRGAGHE